MCGIVGFISHRDYSASLRAATDVMSHRGPDNVGHHFDEFNQWRIGLGHRRLSIIDLSEGANQPFEDSTMAFAIVFNGEIYNYRSLRQQLKDVHFRTDSDTEVLLELYKRKGSKMLNELKGMFSFAILDRNKETIFLARDQLGIKPLYFCHKNNEFAFASEIRGLFEFPFIPKNIDTNCFTEFFLNGFLYEPDTGFKDVFKLPAGHFAQVEYSDQKISVREERYWSPFLKTDKEAKEIKAVIEEEIQDHLVSDAPVGLFFSGGVDSSILLANVKNTTKAITVRSPQGSMIEAGMADDWTYAKKIAKIFDVSLDHIELGSLSGEGFLENIEDLARSIEEPIADYTFVASAFLSAKSRAKGYKVMLSGLGADEIFAGYGRYVLVHHQNFFRPFEVMVRILGKHFSFFEKKVERFSSFYRETDFVYRYTSLIGYFSRDDLKSAFVKMPDYSMFSRKLNGILLEVEQKSSLKKAMYIDLQGFLSHNFTVADKSSMLASQELRVPLATKSLAEITFGASESSLIWGFRAKNILKEYLSRFLPRSIVNRRKTGFNPPLDGLIRSLGKERILEFVSKNELYEVVKEEFVHSLLDSHFSNKVNRTYQIFTLLFFSAWYKLNKN